MTHHCITTSRAPLFGLAIQTIGRTLRIFFASCGNSTLTYKT